MSSILIANQDKTFLNELKDHLVAFHEVKTCCDGRKVLELCQNATPDLLIIDLEMPYLDGLNALHLLFDSGRKPEVLVLSTCLFSNYVLQTLSRMGLSFALPKPCTVEAAATMAYEILGGLNEKSPDANFDVERMLLMLGIMPSLNGHNYLVSAISLMQNDPTLQLTKTVYPAIAAQYHATSTSVERAIRNCIQKTWKKRNQAVWHLFFPLGRDGELPCPTNSQFISRLSICLEKRKIG